MHKLIHSKKQNKQIKLPPELVAAIDRTVEAAIFSKLDKIDSHIEKAIRDCFSNKQVPVSIVIEPEAVRPMFNPEAGP